MNRFDALRSRLTAVPEAARRRAFPPHSRGRILADARAIAPELPRDAGPGQLERAALRVIRRAAQDEFAREGVTHLQLPPEWGRMELREADIPASPAFESFVEEVCAAIVIAPSRLDREDALELRERPASRDDFGLSLEVAADLASYLLHQAWMLRRAQEADAAGGTGSAGHIGQVRELPADTGDEQMYFAGRTELVLQEVRGTLARQVTVPLELRTALERHQEVEGFGGPAPAGGGLSPGAGSDPSATQRARQNFAQHAQAAISFAQTEAGRATVHALRTGAVKAYELFEVKPPGSDQNDQPPKGPGASR